MSLTQNAAPGNNVKSLFAESFNLGPVLGKGAYAPVHLAIHKVRTSRKAAVTESKRRSRSQNGTSVSKSVALPSVLLCLHPHLQWRAGGAQELPAGAAPLVMLIQMLPNRCWLAPCRCRTHHG